MRAASFAAAAAAAAAVASLAAAASSAQPNTAGPSAALAPAAPPPFPWTAGAGLLSVSAAADFSFNVSVSGAQWSLASAGVAVRCGGARYGSDDATLARVGAPAATSGAEGPPGRGAFVALTQAWAAGGCCALQTAVRYFPMVDAFEFTTLFATGCNGSAVLAPTNKVSTDTLASEFPALRLVADSGAAAASLPGFVVYHNGDLGPAEHLFQAPVSPDLAQFAPLAGMDAGLAVLFSPSQAGAPFAPALALGLGNHFLSASMSRTATAALAWGANGYATSLPSNWSLSVTLAARGGVSAAVLAWGESARAQHGTAKVTLDEDPLSSRLGYMEDDGAQVPLPPRTAQHPRNAPPTARPP